jgi:short-subunit dehydrogenase
MRWDGAVVFVTGASGGVGRAAAVSMARRGAQVGLVARSASGIDDTLAAIGGRGASATADVGDARQVADAMAALEQRLGPPAVLVCSAGIGAYGPWLSTDLDVFEAAMHTNYFGALHAMHAVVGGMVERGRGHIVVVGSIAGHVGVPLEAAYSASKFAVSGLVEAVAVELAPRGVAMTLVSPGPINTGFFDSRGEPYHRRFPRPMRPERVAEAIVRAVEHRRAEVVLPRRLRVAMVVRALSPSLYRRGAARALAGELRSSIGSSDGARWRGGDEGAPDRT